MKKLFLAITTLLLWTALGYAQGTGGVAYRFRGGTGAPPTACKATAPADLYYRTSTDVLYVCTTTNTWAILATSGSAGTVTSVSVTSANGFAGTVATATTTPAITISTSITGVLKGNGTAVSAAAAGTDYVAPGAVTTSGLTQATAKMLGRATAGTGAIEEITVTGSGNAVLANTPSLTTPAIGAATGTSLVLSGSLTSNALTSGRIPIAGASGILADDADLTFATDTLTATKVVGSTSITNSALTSGRVVFSGAAGIQSDDSDLTFATDTLTATKIVGSTSITNSALTSGRVVLSGASGIQSDDSDLTFATDTLTFTKGAATTSLTVAGAAVTNNIVQNSQSTAYTTVLGDAGKHLYHPSADTSARTWTIDSNANVAYTIGTSLMFVNDCSAGTLTIAITTDTLVLAGAGTTGSRTLTACGMATALKVAATRWIINGTNLN